MDEMASVTPDDLACAREEFFAERANVVAKNAVSSNGIRVAARVPEGVARNALTFDVEVSQGERCDQEHSGRCWMFASLNTMRYRVIKKYNLKTFELSQSYPLFWDKLEKSNWFFENILDTLDEPLDGRLVSYLLTDPIGDGGQWDMFRSLVKKYGVVPKEAMPETACSRNTHEMDAYLTRYLRGAAKRLRQSAGAGVAREELEEMKKEMMGEVYHLLVTCLGEPPASFEVRLRDKDDQLVLSGTFTPAQFFETAVAMNVDDYVSLISAPTADKPFGHAYTVSRLGNVVEDGGVRYLNLPIERLKACAIAQLRDDLPVWFGCDVAQSYLSKDGIMDTAALDVDALFGFEVEGCMDRAERLDYGESLMTHAMVLEGVNLDAEGHPTLWKVENSWGKDHGRNGFDTISDPWFDEYVYQVVVDKKYLTDEERATYETEEARVLAPWDPMGSLARALGGAMASTRAGALAPETIDELTASFSADRANRVARNAVTSANVLPAARSVTAMRAYRDTFGVSRPRTGKVTNQRHSGRCWMFAAFNVARAATMRLLDVDDFEFSQAFGFFYDKLEKFNVGLERIIETAALPVESREVSGLLEHAMGDGGYYPAAMGIIRKWGLVPKDAMPESACTKDADQMNAQLERLFRKSACELRRRAAAGAGVDELRAEKDRMVAQCHQVLSVCLGEPPRTIDVALPVGRHCAVDPARLVEVEGDDRADQRDGADAGPRRLLVDRGITPREFAERYVPFDPDDFVELVNVELPEYPFGRIYHPLRTETAAEGPAIHMFNVPVEVLEDAAVASLRAGVPCWMACDVSQQFGRRLEDFPGILACDTMDVEGLFGVDLSMSRADMLRNRETRTTHAMTFQGVQLGADGRPEAWRIENSWGEDACKDGYLVASAEWYRTYGGEVVVRREFVPEEWLRRYDEAEVVDVEPWSVVSAAFPQKD